MTAGCMIEPFILECITPLEEDEHIKIIRLDSLCLKGSYGELVENKRIRLEIKEQLSIKNLSGKVSLDILILEDVNIVSVFDFNFLISPGSITIKDRIHRLKLDRYAKDLFDVFRTVPIKIDKVFLYEVRTAFIKDTEWSGLVIEEELKLVNCFTVDCLRYIVIPKKLNNSRW
eukprot:GHVP01054425.1.p1 GENE.GHVP01054425.1~~GHVP01054425.1.p1  ORF type:complete len:173 (-),score=16.44 GHVP01054425.1:308-826(-)